MSRALDNLRQHARSRPRSVALHGSHGGVSYEALLHEAETIAALLHAHSVRVLALAADNGSDWVAADFAAQLAGTVLVPLPPFFNTAQLLHALRDSGADALLADSAGRERLRGMPLAPASATAGSLALARVLERRERPLPIGTAKISYTSGTTGKPKGVCLSQAALDRVAQSLCEATATLAIDRHLCLLPLAMLLENIAGVYAPLERGAEIAVPALGEIGFDGATALDPKRLLACIARFRPGSVILLPQTLSVLVAALESGAERPASLEFAAVGGARVPRALLERADRLDLPVFEGYGLTECASVVALNTPFARRAGSAGRALPHVRITIGAGGEIRVSGTAMLGYTGDTEPAADPIDTGDLGALDADGYVFVNGRRKNLFITSFGRNVSPEWVEAELVGSPVIAQAAVFGEARPWNVAVIVPSAAGASSSDVSAAVAAANSRLPGYAAVRGWILADRPFTPGNGLLTVTGKNRRNTIAAEYRERIEACYPEREEA